jgi:hypothetical protein
MNKPILSLKPKQEPPQPAPELAGVEKRFMNVAIKNKRMMQFVHTDGTITEGIIVGLDRYVIEIEGGILFHKSALKITRFLPLKDA